MSTLRIFSALVVVTAAGVLMCWATKYLAHLLGLPGVLAVIVQVPASIAIGWFGMEALVAGEDRE